MIILEWFSWVIAIGLGFAAILSPVITTFFNNRHEIRMKHLNDFENRKLIAIQNYLDSVTKLIQNESSENILNYYSCLAHLYLYIPEKECIWLNDITDKIGIEDEYKLKERDYMSVVYWLSSLGNLNIHSYVQDLPKSFKDYVIDFFKSLSNLLIKTLEHLGKLVLKVFHIKL